MTVPPAAVSSGAVPAAFELKSAQLTLVALVVKTHDLAIVPPNWRAALAPKAKALISSTPTAW